MGMMRNGWLAATVVGLCLGYGCGGDGDGQPGTGGTGGSGGSGGNVGGSGATGAGGSAPGGGGVGGADCPETTLPGSIDGVEPESMANHAPLIDDNGNLYRMLETPSSDGNNPKMMKSSDGGQTWAEVDAGNRPSSSDLEGTYQLRVGSTIYFSHTRGPRVWFFAFNTSDAASNPDSWLPTEDVDENLTSGGVVQYSSLTQTADGQFWIFYSDLLIDDRQQIAYRRRIAADDYGPKSKIGADSGEWTGPRAVLGDGDVTRVFYKDHENHELLWRTLSADGTLSGATRIDAGGTSMVPVPHTNPVVRMEGGQEVIVVGYTGADDTLKAVTITDGNVGPEEQVSVDPVLQDAPVVANEGAVAHLSLHGSTVHAAWTDETTGDIRHSATSGGGSWSTEQSLWSSDGEEALYVYCSVIEDGCDRLACTYDIGPHEDDTGQVEYLEHVLR